MNNEKEQKELEHEIIELESQLAYKKEKYNRLKFINANSRYFLCETGDIYELTPTVDNEHMEKAVKQNNTFKTVKDAEKERDRRALLYEFNQFKNECNKNWAPNWGDFDELKYFICFNESGGIKYTSTIVLEEFVMFGYFRKHLDCLQAIQKFGDRIKKLYID